MIFTPPREVMEEGAEVGVQRSRDAKRHKSTARFRYEGETKDSDQSHVVGAQAEAAFAWRFGFVWTRSNIWRGGGGVLIPDVLPFWEVRHSNDPTQIKVAVKDPPHRMVVGLTGGERRPYEITGACLAGWAQRTLRQEDPGARGRPAFWAPTRHLMPVEDDFHATHGWTARHGAESAVRTPLWPNGIPEGVWLCAWCGEPYVATRQEATVDG